MIHVAIVEDDADERRELTRCLRELEQEDKVSFMISEYSRGTDFLDRYQQGVDIVFMDIEMPGLNGLETARELRRIDGEVVILFLTHLAQFAIYGYEVEALDFIVKPVNYYRLALKMRRAISRTTRHQEEFIQVKSDQESHQIRISSIRYLEVSGHYVVYHTVGGDYTSYSTLKEAQEKIGQGSFVYANRSYLVNLRYVDAVGKESVTVAGDEIRISRPQKKAFMAAMAEYMGGKR